MYIGVASGSGWNLWVWLLAVVVRRYIDFLILLIPTPLVSVLFCSSIPTFCSFKKMFFKTVCAAFIWLPWDARSCPYVFILRKKFFLIHKM